MTEQYNYKYEVAISIIIKEINIMYLKYIIRKILIFSIAFSLSLGISISHVSAYSSTLSNNMSNKDITII